jgi:hypothetical protein
MKATLLDCACPITVFEHFLLLSDLQIFSQVKKARVATSPANTRPFPLPEKEP